MELNLQLPETAEERLHIIIWAFAGYIATVEGCDQRTAMIRVSRLCAATQVALAEIAREQEECPRCGGTGEVCYSSTSYGPCPECVKRHVKRHATPGP